MKNIFKIFAIILLSSSFSFAQNSKSPIILKIDNQGYSLEEFMYVYTKNNTQNQNIDKKSLEEYLDLYVNFRLKVKEAESQGLDTLSSFLEELNGYRAQLAKPFLTNSNVDEAIMKEAYNRLMFDIRASHIMISVPENVSDNDSIAIDAVRRLNEIRSKALRGESFELLASKYSDDPSARDIPASNGNPSQKGNGGDLGYFTAFYMVYPFESAAYNTAVGQISSPFRTKYGYHLVKVTDKINALGKIKVAHINVKINPSDSLAAISKIKEIKAQIDLKKISFEEAAKAYSDDKGSAQNGGTLPWFEVTRMVPEFIAAISKINGIDGVSEPVLTNYGWHLIKLIELKKTPDYQEYMAELKQKVAKDSRSEISKEAAIESFKKEFKFKETKKSMQGIYSILDSSLYKHNWNKEKANALTKPMFKLDGKIYTQQDFAAYLEKNQGSFESGTLRYFADNSYHEWVNNTVYNYKDSKLETQDFKFKMLVKEYHDGILLFTISDQEVWTKASKDTIGLQSFYELNKSKYNWKTRMDVIIYRFSNDSIASIGYKLIKSGISADSVSKIINKNSNLNMSFESGKYEEGSHTLLVNVKPNKGITEIIKQDNSYMVVDVKDVLPPSIKKLNEAKGIITADYQTYLDKMWIENLHKKYKVEIFKDLLPKENVQK